VYAGAGLSTEPQLTQLSAQYRKHHKESLNADFSDFELTLGVALRQNILTKEDVPIPIKLGRGRDYRYDPPPDVLELELDLAYSFTPLGCAFIAACQPVKGDFARDSQAST
jgi:hypothetical protein